MLRYVEMVGYYYFNFNFFFLSSIFRKYNNNNLKQKTAAYGRRRIIFEIIIVGIPCCYASLKNAFIRRVPDLLLFITTGEPEIIFIFMIAVHR